MIQIRVTLIALLCSVNVHAHHSRAMFDSDNPITLEGRISKATWRNPHVYFEIDVESVDGQVATWVLESASVALLAQSGWNEETLKPGDLVAATVSPHKDETKRYAALNDVALSDGTRMERLVPEELAETDITKVRPSTDFSGTWTIADPDNQDGTVGNEAKSGPSHWPLTDKGRMQVESFDVSEDPMFRCVFYGVPRLASSVYSRRISRESGRIVIQQEQYPVTRIIHLDGSAPPEDFVPSTTGYSNGRFAADGTLIVETTAFSNTPWGSAAGLDSSDQKRVVEEYKLSEDGYSLHYSHTLTDPEYLTDPVTINFTYKKVADHEYVYEECDTDSARIPLKFSSGSE